MSINGISERYPRVKDVALRFGVHERTVWEWVYRGIIPHFKMGRSVFFKWEDIEAELNRHRYIGRMQIPAGTPPQRKAIEAAQLTFDYEKPLRRTRSVIADRN